MNPLKITILNKQRKYKLEAGAEALLRQSLEAALREGLQDAAPFQSLQFSVCLSLVGESGIREMNRKYRNLSKVTDVLSFPMFEFREGRPLCAPELYDQNPPGSSEIFLGDLAICPARAEEQARDYGHSMERELAFLAAHGMLHLLGWDHMESDEELRMRERQRAVMSRLHLEIDHASDLASRPQIRRAGFIALLGRPNVGKSTLLNRIAESELAITSPKPQTTRRLIRAVLRRGDAEMVFLDTPGIHPERHALDRSMTQAIRVAMEEADILVLMLEAGFKPRVEALERRVAEQARERGKKLLIALNKTDRAAKGAMLPLIDILAKTTDCDCIVPISARSGEGVEDLLEEISRRLPERGAIFDETNYTNQTERSLISEFIRGEILLQMEEEIPHGTAVVIERFEEELTTDLSSGEERRARVFADACIYCERENHKGMLLGKGGQRIREIGSRARARIAVMLDCACVLNLYVKVKENWRQRPAALKELGYGKTELD